MNAVTLTRGAEPLPADIADAILAEAVAEVDVPAAPAEPDLPELFRAFKEAVASHAPLSAATDAPRAEYRRLQREGEGLAKAAEKAVPLPAGLIVPNTNPSVLGGAIQWRDGKTTDFTPSETIELDYPAAIDKWAAGDKKLRQEKMALWEEWHHAKIIAAKAAVPGLDEAYKALHEACSQASPAYNKMANLYERICKAKPQTPENALIQLQTCAMFWGGRVKRSGGVVVNQDALNSARMQTVVTRISDMLSVQVRQQRRQAQQDEAHRATWDLIAAELEAAWDRADVLSALHNEAYARVEARMPEMPEEGWMHRKGERDRVLRRFDLVEGETARWLDFIPRQQAARTRQAVIDYWDQYDRLEREEGADKADEAEEAAHVEITKLRKSIYQTRAPGLREIADKVAMFSAYSHNGIGFDDEEQVQRALTVGGPDGFLVELHRDLCALAGIEVSTAHITAFDPAEWISAFEQLPGHEVTQDGPVYNEPEAWPGCPADSDLLITDPTAIAAYETHITANYPEYADERAERGVVGRPVQMVQRETALWAYPHDPAEGQRLAALWDRRRELVRTDPPGRAMWKELHFWQQKAVKDFARLRHLRALEEAAS